MSATNSIPNTDRLNYVNIGLMLLSCLVAFFVPFELFLFSYAVLGPAHYLTEISWLHERKYFSKGKYDYIFLGLAGLLLFFILYIDRIFPDAHVFDHPADLRSNFSTSLVFIAFICGLAMVIFKDFFLRLVAFLLIIGASMLSHTPALILFFSVFLPTLIHVYLFTLLFMLYGSLKGRSKSGYLSCIVMALCPLLFVFITPAAVPSGDYTFHSYNLFSTVNEQMLKLFNPEVFHQSFDTVDQYKAYLHSVIYESSAGLTVMRFIAFAYTYHYLNWFSKTSVIKWHQVPKKRLIVIGVLWAAAVGFYFYKYEIGFHVLFLLSFLHVFLEFPLNHVTFIGIFQETRSILSGKPVAVVAKGGSKKK